MSVICDKYNFKEKLVAQTYDGAAVMAGHLNGLQAKIKSVAPQALFTHCHAHSLNLVLSKACNISKDCRIFFANLSGFAPFFTKSTKRTNVLNQICGSRIPTLSATRWNFTSHSVFTIYKNKNKLIEVFDFIMDSDEFKNDAQSVREAESLKRYLNDQKFCFLLETFKLIFEQTEPIFLILQNKLTDINFSKNRILKLTQTLQDFKNNDNYFNNIYTLISNSSNANRRKTCLDLPNLRLNFKIIFVEILDTIMTQIEVRFSDLDKLKFFDLLTPDNYLLYVKTTI